MPCRNFAAGTTLSGPFDIAISPDGSSLYVANAGNSSILEFDRSAAGALSQKGAAPCVANLGTATCGDARAMVTPQKMAIYQRRPVPLRRLARARASPGSRSAASGALTQLEGSGGLAGCVHPTGADNCDDGKGMSPGSSTLALSPSGGLLYAASNSGKSLSVIIRNPQNGLLAMSTQPNGCIEDVAADGCTPCRPS